MLFFSLQLLLNHHEIETYDSLDYHMRGILATVSVLPKVCVCLRAIREIDN